MLKALNDILIDKPLVREALLSDFKLPKADREKLSSVLYDLGYVLDSYSSYAVTDKAKDDKPANFAIIPNQYFILASEMHEFSSELYKYFVIYEHLRPFADRLVGNHAYIVDKIISSAEMLECFENREDVELFAKFLDKDNAEYRLGSKRLINDQGKPRSSKDCFGSAVLKEINLPDVSSAIFGRLVYDLCAHPTVYKELVESYSEISSSETLAAEESEKAKKVDKFLPKPFLLLAGNSGTGKTRFVREQVKKTGSLKKNYCLTSVRPDWHEPSDLLGYTSRLRGSTEYVVTDVLEFIVSAWRHLWDANKLTVCAESLKSQDERLVVKGGSEDLQGIPPYWLCLDEMNLAPVEQYFSDYLSVIETREWHWQGDSFTYLSDSLLKPSNLEAVENKAQLRKSLKLEESKYDGLWSLFFQFGIGIPFNLIVAGTVNMDETTHGFSRKVIDRALSFDFGEFFPNDFDHFFESSIQNKSLSFPIYSQAKKEDLQGCFDKDGALSIAFLSKVNLVLDKTQFKLAYRALNELLLAVICQNPQTEVELKAVWDDFLMCKLLPRIEGDIDKLGSDSSLLKALNKALKVEFTDFWGKPTRPDLFRESKDKDVSPLLITCRSKEKLEWMQERLDTSGFTSFWP